MREDDHLHFLNHLHFLMGGATLKSHHVGDRYFSPDGYFGIHPYEFSLPLDDRRLLQQFRKDFRLQRTDEPGLSVVVPWYDVEEITFDRLLEAVLREYYYPILSGSLSVTVETPGRKILIDDETLYLCAQSGLYKMRLDVAGIRPSESAKR